MINNEESQIELFQKIKILPEELIYNIKKYLSNTILLWLNKEYYIKNHHLVIFMLPRKNLDYDNFIRHMIRNDFDFVIKTIYDEYYKNFYNRKRYRYKNNYYSNYYSFLLSFCIDNNAIKCRNILKKLKK